jgi:hypothetical protein
MPRTLATWRLAVPVVALCALSARGADVDRFVPAEATALASVNVRKLLDAPLVRRHALEAIRASLQENAPLQRLLTAAGTDPLRDVSGVVVAVGGTKADQVLVIVHGTFDADRVRKAAEQTAREHPDQLKLHQEGAAVIYEDRSPKRACFAAFADSGTVVASLSRSAVAAAVRGGRGTASLRPEMQALVARADATKTAWLVALAPPELKKQLMANQNTAPIADRVKSLSATLEVDGDVEALVHVYTTDGKAADSLAEMLDGMRGVVKLLAQNGPGVGDLVAQVVDATRVGARRSTVEVRVRVSGEAIGKALRKR